MSRVGPAPQGIYSDDNGKLVGLRNPDGTQISLKTPLLHSVLNTDSNNNIIYIGDSFVGRSLGANGLAGNQPCLSGFPFWVQFLSAGKMNLFGILGFSGYTTAQLAAIVPMYAQYLIQADYIFAEGGINDSGLGSLAARIASLEAYWAPLLALGPQLIVPTINPNWETAPTETINAFSEIIGINDYIIKQGKKGRFLVADIAKRLVLADGSFTGNLRNNAAAVVTGPPHLAVLGVYYYSRAIVDDVINQIPGLSPAPRGVQEPLNPYIINNNSLLSGNVASGTANANTVLTGVTGTAPYQWSASNYGSGVTCSCNVATIDDQIASDNPPVLGQVDFAQWNFSLTTTTASTGIQIFQLFGMLNGDNFASLHSYPRFGLGYYWVQQNGATYKALVPYGSAQAMGANSLAAISTTVGETGNDGVIWWQCIPPIHEGTVVQVSVRIQLLTNPLNVPMNIGLSLIADNSTPSHQAVTYILNCGQEVACSGGYIAGGFSPGLDYPSDYLPFGTGEELLLQSLPIVLRDPIGGGLNLETLAPYLNIFTSAPSASPITFALRDFEVRVIGQKPTISSPVTYY